MKTILEVRVQRNNGSWFDNPLKLSEVNLIPKIAKENKQIIITMQEVTSEVFKMLFG